MDTQFAAWGSYRAQQSTLANLVLANAALEVTAGIGIASTMLAGALTVPLAAKLGTVAALPALNATGTLFARVFPYTARVAVISSNQIANATARASAQAASVAATRVAAGVIRAASGAAVAATVVTAVVTIVPESIIIAERAQIPVTLLDNLEKARSTAPDLLAVAQSNGGAGVLLSTFLATTVIDVDPNCRLQTPEDPYSAFPCSNAPTPPAGTSDDDRFYVVPEGGIGSFSPTIYTAKPLDSVGDVVLPELTRLNTRGWFVTTKYQPPETNLTTATVPGATLQTTRLYYRGWDGGTRLAERVAINGRPTFVTAPVDKPNLGGCATKLPDGSSACITNVLQYLAPDGTRVSAQVVSATESGPVVDGYVPDQAVVGVPVALRATANERFTGTAPFTYQRRLPADATVYEGPNVQAAFKVSGKQQVTLTVTDAAGGQTVQRFDVQVAGNSTVDVSSVDLSAVGFGTAPRLIVNVRSVPGEHAAGCVDNTVPATSAVQVITTFCPGPRGTVQLSVDGQTIGGPIALRPGFTQTYGLSGGIEFFLDSAVASSTTGEVALPTQLFQPGTTHTLRATFSGDGNLRPSFVERGFTKVKGPAAGDVGVG